MRSTIVVQQLQKCENASTQTSESVLVTNYKKKKRKTNAKSKWEKETTQLILLQKLCDCRRRHYLLYSLLLLLLSSVLATRKRNFAAAADSNLAFTFWLSPQLRCRVFFCFIWKLLLKFLLFPLLLLVVVILVVRAVVFVLFSTLCPPNSWIIIRPGHVKKLHCLEYETNMKLWVLFWHSFVVLVVTWAV